MRSPTWAPWLTERKDVTLGDVLSLLVTRHGRWACLLVPAIYAGCLAAFVADLTSTHALAFGVFYAPLVVTAVFHRDPRAVWFLASIASTLVVVGACFPTVEPDLWVLIGNLILSLCAVLATSAFVRHARSIQDQLAEQTSRAEAAESMKAEVLTNLSEEIRAPLYSMIGVLELVAADSRAEQKTALHMVRSGVRRLVTTVDNLVDLTQFDEKSLPAESFDLGLLLRQTVEANRSDATARQIKLTVAILPGGSLVHANPWAVRRILENLIGDAVTHTPPGGRILVRTATENDALCTVITDTGTRPPGAFRAANDVDFAGLMPTFMGLALSHRLARVMRARLSLSSGPGEGTTARLRLPEVTRPDADDV